MPIGKGDGLWLPYLLFCSSVLHSSLVIELHVSFLIMSKFTPPQEDLGNFNCPHCGTYTTQHTSRILRTVTYVEMAKVKHASSITENRFNFRICHQCEKATFWFDGKLMYPNSGSAPLPNQDLPEDIKADYLEASSILGSSPRGAAALLRLCVQKLCKALGKPGKDINADIGSLVQDGLPIRIQQALDVVRVVGNEAVHPGTIDLNDKPETAASLFNLINMIANDRITQPREIEALYSALPEGKLEGIKKRDGNT